MPYTDEMFATRGRSAGAGRSANDPSGGLLKRYPKAVVRKLNRMAADITEVRCARGLSAVLGALVDFNLYDDKASLH